MYNILFKYGFAHLSHEWDYPLYPSPLRVRYGCIGAILGWIIGLILCASLELSLGSCTSTRTVEVVAPTPSPSPTSSATASFATTPST